MTALYNEIDAFCCAWLSNLMDAGHITPGKIDDRSIVDLNPDDVRGYERVHFFAGIGIWDYALNLAGWPDDRPVWTGSCPCQPFSTAGQQRGSEDERHLWPAFFRLIRECRPPAVAGEQVAGASGLAWLDHVAADLEDAGYAVAAANLGAHSVGAPHLRQRLYWVAKSGESERGSRWAGRDGKDGGWAYGELAGPGAVRVVADTMHAERWALDEHREDGRDGANSGRQEAHGIAGTRGQVRIVADSRHDDGTARTPWRVNEPRASVGEFVGGESAPRVVAHADHERCGKARGSGTAAWAGRDCSSGVVAGGHESEPVGLADPELYGRDGAPLPRSVGARENQGRLFKPEGCSAARIVADLHDEGLEGRERMPERAGQLIAGESGASGFWDDLLWLPCRDGKYRPTQPGLFPLAHGATSRVGRLRAYGNAIVAPLAAEFIGAVMDCRP